VGATSTGEGFLGRQHTLELEQRAVKVGLGQRRAALSP